MDSPLLICAVLLSCLSDVCPIPSAGDFIFDSVVMVVVVVVVVCLTLLFGHDVLALVIVILMVQL